MEMFAQWQKAEKEKEDQLVQAIGPQVNGLQPFHLHGLQQASGQPVAGSGDDRRTGQPLLQLRGRQAPFKEHVAGDQPDDQQQNKDRLAGVIATVLRRNCIALRREQAAADHRRQGGSEYERGGQVFEQRVDAPEGAAQTGEGEPVKHAEHDQRNRPQRENHEAGEQQDVQEAAQGIARLAVLAHGIFEHVEQPGPQAVQARVRGRSSQRRQAPGHNEGENTDAD